MSAMPAVSSTIAPVSKQTLFIRDLLLIGCFTLSGDSALLIRQFKMPQKMSLLSSLVTMTL